ncbi:MAG: complex I NDUFA9 subunit family protein [Pseudomonadota bacterium]|nr:complex I NDUFA9 subunit family protein [Sphingomonas sp.]MDQ3477738.1 complex I NDUFA9 subunit family protein [Pseudomonadota bacterium]
MINPDNRIVTIFGGGGFIGRYVSEILFNEDVRVRVAARNPRCAHSIQPLGRVGQWGVVRADVTDPASVRAAVEASSAVINLTGVLKGKFDAIHSQGARAIAEAAHEVGATSLVHISALGADPKSDSNYGRSKGEGEIAVRSAFPTATIIRPSIVFGPEDDLTNRLAGLARLPMLPVIAAERQFQPVYVKDLAKAIAMAALDPQTHGGKTYDIGGPQVMTMEQLFATAARAAGREPNLIALPDFASAFLAWFGFLPGAPITRDQWKMLQSDNLPAERAKGIAAFGIKPTALEAVAPQWLGRHRQGGRFANQPV